MSVEPVNLLADADDAPVHDRRKFIGSSDVPIIMGLVPPEWGTPVQLWAEKTGMFVVRRPMTAAMERGTLLEPFIPQMAEAAGIAYFVSSTIRDQRIFREDLPFPASAQIDFVYGDEDGITQHGEVKTVGFDRNHEWGPSDSQEIPRRVYAQIQYGLMVGKRHKCMVLAWVEDELRRYDINANPEYQKEIVTACDKFWQNVCQKTAPEPVNAKDSNIATPANGSGIEASLPLIECVNTLREIKAVIKPLEKQESELAERIKMHMGAAETLFDGNGTTLATWKNTKPKLQTESDWAREVEAIKREFLNKRPQRRLLLKGE